jgi:hypothetical protein
MLTLHGGIAVISARVFLVLWSLLTAAVIAYAFADLWVSPALWGEHSFSMQPDWSQIWEVRHWGGRLVREHAWALLACNAVVLGGLLALAGHGVARLLLKRRSHEDDLERENVLSGHMPSVPPSA